MVHIKSVEIRLFHLEYYQKNQRWILKIHQTIQGLDDTLLLGKYNIRFNVLQTNFLQRLIIINIIIRYFSSRFLELINHFQLSNLIALQQIYRQAENICKLKFYIQKVWDVKIILRVLHTKFKQFFIIAQLHHYLQTDKPIRNQYNQKRNNVFNESNQKQNLILLCLMNEINQLVNKELQVNQIIQIFYRDINKIKENNQKY
ncbi:unnamed protein product [Paramecium primaurelia]|uniref:Uncharacterized protein n=1 Tax=Paramecium primaurelia TaxID=5886 RepID=A0A8S1QV58_PARPR|nr:unnamed protein product [Paramecium primaurelia]